MRTHWFPGFVFAIVALGMVIHLLPLRPSILALQLSFDSASFQRVVKLWGPAGVAHFREHLPADYVCLVA